MIHDMTRSLCLAGLIGWLLVFGLACNSSGSGTGSGDIVITVPISVTVSPSTARISPAQSQLFTATVKGTTQTAVTWTTNGGTINATGSFQSQQEGVFRVRATSVADTSKFGEATVTVFNQPPVGVRVGNTATDLQGLDRTGQNLILSAHRGKVILLDLSTIWSASSAEKALGLQALFTDYSNRGLVVFSVLMQNESFQNPTTTEVANWVTTHGLTFSVINDPGQKTLTNYQPESIPTYLLIDKNFVIQLRQSNMEPSALRPSIEALLAAP